MYHRHMPTHIIGLVGRQGAGKGAAADILKEAYGAKVFRFSAVLSDILTRLSVQRSRENLTGLSEALRKLYGEDVLSYAVGRDVLASQDELAVIDGIRRIEDIAAFEPQPNFRLIEVSAPAKVRFDRMKGRGEKVGESSMDWATFEEQERFPTEVSIAAVAARAWKAIDNAGSPEDLRKHLDEAMAELGVRPVT
jgi:dephospho-CoA kinase